jgi:adenine deaminase
MVLYKRASIDSAKLFNDFRLKYISSRDRLAWRTSSDTKWFTNKEIDGNRPFFQRVLAQVKIMKKAGLRFLAGTDYDNPFLYPGFSLHDELALFVEAGFTPMEALQTATINPAKFLGTTDSLGTIEKGKIADMILLNADPLIDIHNTKQIQAVFVNGKYLPKQTVEAMLVKVEQAVNKN